jgi:hypothetical protein
MATAESHCTPEHVPYTGWMSPLLSAPLAIVAVAGISYGQSPDWITFPGDGFLNPVRSLRVLDIGDGSRLYAAGHAGSVDGQPMGGVAVWNGRTWVSIGGAVSGGNQPRVQSLALWTQDGAQRLVGLGSFTAWEGSPAGGVALWNGQNWAGLGSGIAGLSFPEPEARAGVVFDDGSGSSLFVGGLFSSAGGAPALNMAKWTGVNWQGVGDGLNGIVRSLVVADLGSGPRLIAGGDFTASGAQPILRVGSWDGVSWSQAANGFDNNVRGLVVTDTGSGPRLYASGSFTHSGALSVRGVARWTTNGWEDTGFGQPADYIGVGLDQCVLARGSASIGRLTPTGWQFIPASVNQPSECVAEFDDGSGPALYMGGWFSSGTGFAWRGVARYRALWEPLGTGATSAVNLLKALEVDGLPRLFAGSSAGSIGGRWTSGVAMWDGSTWSTFGTTLQTGIWAIAVHDRGLGPRVLAAGSPGATVWEWNSTAWLPLGSLAGGTQILGLESFGGDLFVAGNFTGGLARWNGSAWTAIAGPQIDVAIGGSPRLKVLNLGAGPRLCLFGSWITLEGQPASVLAFDGTTWSRLVSGHDNPIDIEFFSSGLYGAFTGISSGILRVAFAGTWQTVLTGTGSALSLSKHDDGSGPALFISGDFTSIGGQPISRIARWDGALASLGSGLAGTGGTQSAYSLASFDADGVGPRTPLLVVGGTFRMAGGQSSARIAAWGTIPVACYANCDSSAVPPILNVLDFNCFLNHFASGDPYANCDLSTVPPVLNVLDFNCFLNRFAAGCP